MIFSSLVFIFKFLPLFLILYYIVPIKYKNLLLFIFSIIFYSFGDAKCLIFLLLSVIVNYYVAIKIDKSKQMPIIKKRWFLLSLGYNLGMLIFFKYTNFLIQIINIIPNHILHIKGLPSLAIILPLGISFYTFQVISYIIDVYRGDVKAEKNFITMGVYVCMFPKLISGPIFRFSDFKEQMEHRDISFAKISFGTTSFGSLENGLKMFTIGLGFKVLLADRIAFLWNDIQTIGFESISTPLAWLGIFGYSLQLYFDFYGYSLMAIGIGKMLGFSLPENFRHPYMSRSVSEFWRRWHITLGTWFKDYIYIPLGGNRKGVKRLVLNLLLVWTLTGIWHGAGFGFVLWGMFLFLLILLEKLYLKKWLDKYNILSRIYVLFVVPVSWMFFAINQLSDIRIYFGRLFSLIPGNCVNTNDFIKYFSQYWWLFIFGIFFCMPFAEKWYTKHEKSMVCALVLFFVFWISIYFITNSANNPFMYFKF